MGETQGAWVRGSGKDAGDLHELRASTPGPQGPTAKIGFRMIMSAMCLRAPRGFLKGLKTSDP